MKNKSSIFVAYFAKSIFYTKKSSSYFYGYAIAALSKDIRLSNPCWLLHFRSNVLWRVWEAIAFLILVTLIFHSTMPKYNENASKVKYSSLTSTPDCESVKNYLNLLPKSEQNSQGLENVDTSIVVGSDANGSKISSIEGNSQSSEQNDGEGILGNNVESSNIQNGTNLSSQTNHVDKNTGITGISGSGHTIYNYACPPEIIEFISLLAKKGGVL
jgi:hypothetical protein